MLNNIEAVIFDLDGTLVDSMWLWYEIDVDYLARFGLELPEDLPQKVEGMSFPETAAYVKERFQLPDSTEKIMQDWNDMAWDYYMHRVPLKKGVLDFLKHCKMKNVKLGIATSNSHVLVDNLARVLGLDTFMSTITTACDARKGKPAPDIYLMAADRLGVAPHKCLVFEDIIPGIMAGRSAGMKVCAVEDEYSIHQTTEKKELADYYIKDYTQVLNGTYEILEA